MSSSMSDNDDSNPVRLSDAESDWVVVETPGDGEVSYFKLNISLHITLVVTYT